MNLNVPAVNTTKYGLKSISYSCAKMWNSLNNNMKCAESLKEFKSLLSKWKMKQCTCSFCSYCILNKLCNLNAKETVIMYGYFKLCFNIVL